MHIILSALSLFHMQLHPVGTICNYFITCSVELKFYTFGLVTQNFVARKTSQLFTGRILNKKEKKLRSAYTAMFHSYKAVFFYLKSIIYREVKS